MARERGRHKEPRRTITSRILDRLTPPPMRVYYGPDGTAGGGSLWRCSRCARRKHANTRLGHPAGWYRTLAAARTQAREHARKHRFMRAVYEEG